MPSIFTHAAVPLALWCAADRGRISTPLLAAAVIGWKLIQPAPVETRNP